MREGVAVSVSGKEIPIEPTTVCVHSDTPGAAELAQAVASKLEELT
jgi:UPF0271 protein